MPSDGVKKYGDKSGENPKNQFTDGFSENRRKIYKKSEFGEEKDTARKQSQGFPNL